ncbi:hypothetical protein D3C81_1609760 [compost metagenome]
MPYVTAKVTPFQSYRNDVLSPLPLASITFCSAVTNGVAVSLPSPEMNRLPDFCSIKTSPLLYGVIVRSMSDTFSVSIRSSSAPKGFRLPPGIWCTSVSSFWDGLAGSKAN